MRKFRILSDLHVDVNQKYSLQFSDNDVFTVICGDTSGNPDITIEWVNQNVKRGILISGNHLPYCNFSADVKHIKTMDALRQKLASQFPIENDITYLDVLTGTFKKVVDGIMFIGTTMYTDMLIQHDIWNKFGDIDINTRCAEFNMNDFRCGYKKIQTDDCSNSDVIKIRALDYNQWFISSFKAIDAELIKNETSDSPLPVVLITHHPLIKQFCEHSYYVDDAKHINSIRDFNWASYASNREYWLRRHNSIKCYCCGHVHSVEDKYRSFKIRHNDGSDLLVVNNSRGYVSECQDASFNANRYVDVVDWNVIDEPESAEQLKQKKECEMKFERIMLNPFVF